MDQQADKNFLYALEIGKCHVKNWQLGLPTEKQSQNTTHGCAQIVFFLLFYFF